MAHGREVLMRLSSKARHRRLARLLPACRYRRTSSSPLRGSMPEAISAFDLWAPFDLPFARQTPEKAGHKHPHNIHHSAQVLVISRKSLLVDRATLTRLQDYDDIHDSILAKTSSCPPGVPSVEASQPPSKINSLQLEVPQGGGTKSQAEGLMPTPRSDINSETFVCGQYCR